MSLGMWSSRRVSTRRGSAETSRPQSSLLTRTWLQLRSVVRLIRRLSSLAETLARVLHATTSWPTGSPRVDRSSGAGGLVRRPALPRLALWLRAAGGAADSHGRGALIRRVPRYGARPVRGRGDRGTATNPDSATQGRGVGVAEGVVIGDRRGSTQREHACWPAFWGLVDDPATSAGRRVLAHGGVDQGERPAEVPDPACAGTDVLAAGPTGSGVAADGGSDEGDRAEVRVDAAGAPRRVLAHGGVDERKCPGVDVDTAAEHSRRVARHERVDQASPGPVSAHCDAAADAASVSLDRHDVRDAVRDLQALDRRR